MNDHMPKIEARVARTQRDPFFVSDCEGALEVWRESALTHVRRDENGEIDMYSLPSSYRMTDQVIEIDLETWDPGEDPTDDQRRQDVTDLVDARASEPILYEQLQRALAQRAQVLALHQKGEHNGMAICLHCAGLQYPPPGTGIWSESGFPCATLKALGVIGAAADEDAAAMPLLVERFDTALESAPEEEPVLTVGAVAQDGRPVALLLDEETRGKVAGWLVPAQAEARRDTDGQTRQLRLAREFRVPLPNTEGGYGEVAVERFTQAEDRWAVTDGSFTGKRAWTDGEWHYISDVGRRAAYCYGLDEALKIAHDVAAVEAASLEASIRQARAVEGSGA